MHAVELWPVFNSAYPPNEAARIGPKQRAKLVNASTPRVIRGYGLIEMQRKDLAFLYVVVSLDWKTRCMSLNRLLHDLGETKLR